MRIELVSSEVLTRVIADRETYRGRKFLTDNGDIYTACDNSDGNAWTEDFGHIVDAIAWLEGQGRREDYIGKCRIMLDETGVPK